MTIETKILYKGFRYRLYPNKKQAKFLDRHMFVSSQVYNYCIKLQQDHWELIKNLPRESRTHLDHKDLYRECKKHLDIRKLSYSATIVEFTIHQFDEAFCSFLQKTTRFPQFKKSSLIRKMSFPWGNQAITPMGDSKDSKDFKYLKLMRQKFPMEYHRPFPEDYSIREATISRKNGKYYVSFCISYSYTPLNDPITSSNLDISKAVGIDFNMDHIDLSNTNTISIPTKSKEHGKKKYEKRMKLLQRKQSRRVEKCKRTKIKVKTLKNFAKTQLKINKIFEKASNQQNDYYHKLTHDLSKEFDMVSVERLDIKDMAKGNPRSRNRSLNQVSFFKLRQMMKRKQEKDNKLYIEVDPAYTSKTCHKCGHIKKNLKLSDRIYNCPSCGYVGDRDHNASINILVKGLKSLGVGYTLQDIKHESPSSFPSDPQGSKRELVGKLDKLLTA